MKTRAVRNRWCIVLLLIFIAVNPIRIFAATCYSVKSGKWSDPAVWSGGKVPGATTKDDAVITAGTTVVVDIKINTTVGKKFLNPIGSIVVQANATLLGDGTGSSNLNFGTDSGEDLLNNGIIDFSGPNRIHFNITKSSRWGGNGKFSLDDLEVDNGARLTFTQSGDAGTVANFTINIEGNFQIRTGSITASPTVAFNFNGNKSQNLSTSATFYDIYINNPQGVYLVETLTGYNLKGNLHIQNGVLYTGLHNLSGNGTNIITVGAGGELNIGTINNEYNGYPSNFRDVILDPASTVHYSANGQQTVFPKRYGNLTISGSRAGAQVIFPNQLQYPSFDVTVYVQGTFSPLASFTTGGYRVAGSKISFIGSAAQTIPAFNYHNLDITGDRGTNSITLAPGVIGVENTFKPEATFAGGNYVTTNNTFNFNGLTNQTISAFPYFNLTSSSIGSRVLATDGNIKIAGAFTPGTNSYTVTGSSLEFNGAGTQTIPAFQYFNLISSNSGVRTLPATGTVRIANIFTPGTNNYTVTGSTVEFNGADEQTIPAFTYHNLTSSGTGARTLSNTGIIRIANIFTPGANAYTVGGSTVEFNGAAPQTIPAFQYFNLASAGTGSRTLAAGSVIRVENAFTPGSNSYTVTGSTVELNGSGEQTIPAFSYHNLTSSGSGNRVLATTGTIRITGAFTPGSNPYAFAGSTLEFNGTAAQTIPAFQYFNLVSSSTGARMFATNGPIQVAGAFTPGSNNYTVTSSTLEFNGAGTQTIPAFQYFNLLSAGSGARTLPATGTVRIGGSFTPGTNVYTVSGSTVEFNGTIAQTIPAFQYHNLTSLGTGSRNLATNGPIKISGLFTPGTNNYIVSDNIVELNGTVAQTLPAFSYQTLVISGSDKNVTNGNPVVQKALRFTTGKITTGSNKIIIAENGTVENASATGYVIGNLEKYFAAGAAVTQTYEIGHSTAYTPVTITFPQVSLAGSLAITAINGEHPRIAESCLDETKSLNMFWRVAPTAIQPLQYNAGFTYVPAALDAGTATTRLISGFYNNAWNYGTTQIANNVINVANIATAGDILFAQRAIPVVVTNPVNTAVVADNNTSFGVTASGKFLGYQWQVNKGSGWSNITADGIHTGITAPTLTLTKVTGAMDTYQYRLILSGGCGPMDTSAVASLEVNTFPVIATQPVATTACPGTASFGVIATGNLLKYAWQLSTNGGTTWVPVTDGNLYSNTATPTLTISGSTFAMNTYRYRCAVTGRGNLTTITNAAILTVLEPVHIKTQPVNNTTCQNAGTGFSVVAGGAGLQYQWQANAGSGWENLAENDTYAGVTGVVLTIRNTPLALTNIQYRCVVKGTCEPFEVISAAATLKVNPIGTWVGTSSDWSTATNWCGGTPTASTDVKVVTASAPQISGTAVCRNLTIESGASVAIATGSLTVNGDLILNGPLSVGTNKLTINGPGIGGNPNNLITTSGSTLEIGGSGTNLVLPANTTALRDLIINNQNGVALRNNLSLNGTLTLSRGKLALNTSNLTITGTGSIAGADSTRYIVTNNNPLTGGYLIQRVTGSNLDITFPVGTATSYSPAKIRLATGSTADNFRVRVFDGVLTKGISGENGTNGIVSNNLSVKRTWLIEETNLGGSNASITLGWSAEDEAQSFRRSTCAVAHYTNNKWDWGSTWGAATYENGYYTQTRTGLTSFSPFTVVDNALAQVTTVNAKLLLDGTFDKGTGLMNTALNEYDLIPLTQPYTTAPWNYGGGETVTRSFLRQHPEIVDWVLLEIRTSTGLNARVVRKACFLKNDGTLLDIDGSGIPTFNGIESGNYYIIVRHRNHLTTMSASTVSITSSSPIYDFTTGSTKFYGGFAKHFGNNVYGSYAGDANNDGEIDGVDANIYWKINNGKTGYYNTDFNLDGETDAIDSNLIWAPNNGMLSPVE